MATQRIEHQIGKLQQQLDDKSEELAQVQEELERAENLLRCARAAVDADTPAGEKRIDMRNDKALKAYYRRTELSKEYAAISQELSELKNGLAEDERKARIIERGHGVRTVIRSIAREYAPGELDRINEEKKRRQVAAMQTMFGSLRSVNPSSFDIEA